MALFELARVPEPEVMEDCGEVEAYSSAAAQAYLRKIDESFVAHVARLLPLRPVAGTALDIGCGPGQIPIMMARRWPGLRILGVDASPAMIEQARRDAAAAGVAISFQVLRLGRGESGNLPFNDGSFDLVTCNSVMHHLAQPAQVLDEIARLAKPAAAVLVRDLRRPSVLAFPLHVRWFGRKYSGEMRRLYQASVRASYTMGEMRRLLAASRLQDGGARVFRHRLTHLGIERTAA